MEAWKSFEEPEKWNEEPERFYRCGDCGEEYESKKEAENCCAAWSCDLCGDEYDTKKEANDCCSE